MPLFIEAMTTTDQQVIAAVLVGCMLVCDNLVLNLVGAYLAFTWFTSVMPGW